MPPDDQQSIDAINAATEANNNLATANKNVSAAQQEVADTSAVVLDKHRAATDGAKNYANAQQAAAASTTLLQSAVNNAGKALESLRSTYTAMASKNREGFFSPEDTRNIALFNTALLGAVDTASNFSGLGIDSAPILGPINEMMNAIQNGNGSVKDLGDMFVNVFKDKFPQIVGMSAEAAINFGKNLLTSSQNTIHLRDAMLKLGASTGNLDDIYKAAGPNLENINELAQKQTIAINNIAEVMGIGHAEATKYYTELGRIPGMLIDSSTSSVQLTDKMDNMTAAMAFAKGSGRDMSDVVTDLKTAMQDFGLKGLPALSLLDRVGQISSHLDISLDKTRSQLQQLEGQFARFANTGEASARMVEGLTEITNQYAQALQLEGMSGEQALTTATNMVSAISNMGIAQKAFLSSQTGGPGGLMGAFQIEKDLREGKIGEVFKKVREQMQKQLGPIVSIDEASQSQAAAAQRTRQQTLLMQGPLAQFAKTPEEAGRLLDSLKRGDTGVTPLDNKGLQKTIDKGTVLADQTKTEMHHANITLQRLLDATSGISLNLTQRFTAARGSTAMGEGESAGEEDNRFKLRNQKLMSLTNANQVRADMKESVAKGPQAGNTAERSLYDTTGEFVNKTSNLVEDFKKGATEKTNEMYNELVTKMKSAFSSGNTAQASKLSKQVANYYNEHMNDLGDNVSSSSILGDMSAGNILKPSINNAAQQNITTPRPEAANTIQQNTVAHTTAHGDGKLGNIDVHVTGYCLQCKREIEGGSHVRSINPSSQGSQ